MSSPQQAVRARLRESHVSTLNGLIPCQRDSLKGSQAIPVQ